MTYIENVSIKRFKSIRDIVLPLDRITVLVGTNNAGKSSILQAVQFGVSVVQSLAISSLRANKRAESGTLAADQLVYTPLRDVQTLAQGGKLRQDPLSSIQIGFQGGDFEARIMVRRGKNSNLNVKLSGDGVLIGQLESMTSPFSAISPGLAGIPPFEEFRSPAVARKAAAFGDANSVFRNILLLLKNDPAAWHKFEERMRRLFPEVDVRVEFDPENDSVISTSIVRAGVRLPVDAAGTGILQAAQILAYVGVYRPQILILDEPDSHLHPSNQRQLIELLDDITLEDDFQVILSTHSRHLLDECVNQGAMVHWIDKGSVRETDSPRLPMLLALGALDAGDRLQAGDIDTVVLTEDSKTRYLKAILQASGFDLERVTIWPYNGCTRMEAAKVLAGFIGDIAPGSNIVIHRDRDYLSEDECLEMASKYESAGFGVFFTRGTDIESHFLDVAHLASIYRELDESKIADGLDRAMQASRDDSIRILANERFRQLERDWNPATGRKPAAGDVTRESEREYDSDPIRFRHGKKTLSALNRIANDEWGGGKDVAVVSSALVVSSLQELVHGSRDE